MSLLIFCAILATLFFWAVGAYNRLVVLRANIAKQFSAVDAQLLRVLVWLQGNLPASMRDMLSEMEEAALPEACLPWSCNRSIKTAWPWPLGPKPKCVQAKAVKPRGSSIHCLTSLTA
jgi:hypothetical protein